MGQKGQKANWNHIDTNKNDNLGLWIKPYTVWTKKKHFHILHVPIIGSHGGERNQDKVTKDQVSK